MVKNYGLYKVNKTHRHSSNKLNHDSQKCESSLISIGIMFVTYDYIFSKFSVMDASAKIPSGFLRGNANQLGDFDLCTEIRTKVKLKEDKSIKIKGKYCLANIDVVAADVELKLPVHLMQGRNLLRSRLEDVS